MMRRFVVNFSGGISSWAAAKRIKETNPVSEIHLVFADTSMEDEDTYRFVVAAAANVGAPLHVIRDGRTPWDVFADEKYLGNSRVDPCSRVLKRELLDRFRAENFDPSDTGVVVGLMWDEGHRFEKLTSYPSPWRFFAPLLDPPYLTKPALLAEAKRQGLPSQRLYEMGFAHANCGGFCVKAGHGHFAKLLQEMPERYAWHEEKEEALRQQLGKDVAILRDRSGGTVRTLTLREFRGRAVRGDYDVFDLGGCGCAIIDEEKDGGAKA